MRGDNGQQLLKGNEHVASKSENKLVRPKTECWEISPSFLGQNRIGQNQYLIISSGKKLWFTGRKRCPREKKLNMQHQLGA